MRYLGILLAAILLISGTVKADGNSSIDAITVTAAFVANSYSAPPCTEILQARFDWNTPFPDDGVIPGMFTMSGTRLLGNITGAGLVYFIGPGPNNTLSFLYRPFNDVYGDEIDLYGNDPVFGNNYGTLHRLDRYLFVPKLAVPERISRISHRGCVYSLAVFHVDDRAGSRTEYSSDAGDGTRVHFRWQQSWPGA